MRVLIIIYDDIRIDIHIEQSEPKTYFTIENNSTRCTLFAYKYGILGIILCPI